jgi:hypothetical protein
MIPGRRIDAIFMSIKINNFVEVADILKEEIRTSDIVFRCCGQFYVHRDNILRHDRKTYRRLYDWLMITDVDSYYTSRCFEYLWHLIFTGNHKDRR